MTIDVDLVRTNHHITVGLEGRQLFARRFLESRGVEIQHIDQLLLNVLDHGGCGGGAGADLLCGVQHTGQIARFTTGLCLLATAPEADLGDRYADKYQQDGGLDVGTVVDGEPTVRSGEKEIEPGRTGDGGEQAGHPKPGRSRTDDEQDEYQRRVGVIDGVAHQSKQGTCDQGRQEGDQQHG